jgi:hypothetical protein
MMKKLSDQQLGEKMGGETDPETMGIAQAEKQRRDQVRAGAPKMMAGGGAVAFKKGGIDTVNREDTEWAEGKPKEEDKKVEKPVAKAPVAKAPAKAPVSATPYQDMLRKELAALDAPSPEVESLRKTRAELEKRTAGGVEGEMDRQQKLREKFGVDPAQLIAEERARYQEELKLSTEDYRKAEHLRYAQMFAKFGSTPGPTLKAALVAIDETVPDLLDDKAKVTAVRREIGKAMHDLNKQEYQEKKGNFEKANEAYESAVGKITTLNMDLRKMTLETDLKRTQVVGGAAEREIAAISGEKQAGMSAAATRYAADKREAGETARAKIQEQVQARKDKEYQNKVNAMASSELREFDKANFEAVEAAKNTIAIEGANEKVKAIEQAKLDRIANERREKIRNLQERYPESNIGKELERDGGKPAGGEIKYSTSDIENRVNQYK